MVPLAASALGAGFDHSLGSLETQWADAKAAGVVHVSFDQAEANARGALGNLRDHVARRAMPALLNLQALQDAAFLRTLDAFRESIAADANRAAFPIPPEWKKYSGGLEKIAKRFGSMSPTAQEAVDVWIRSGVLDPSFAAGQRKALTARDLGGLTPYMQFVTRRDEKVREAHASLDEFIAATAWDGWVVEVGPPLEWNCRCVLARIPWQLAIRLGFSTVFPRGTSKLQAFRARGGADPKFPRTLLLAM